MEYRFLKSEVRENGIVVLTLANPASLNALNSATLQEINHFVMNLPESASLLIITGEGKFDEQSKMGKVYQGIVDALENVDKLKVICALDETDEDFVYAIVPDICSKEESLKNPQESLIKLLHKMF